MAQAPTPEECARHILTVFASLNRRAGDALRLNSLMVPFSQPPFRASDYDIGCDFAVQNGWIEATGQSLKLTDAGYSEMEN